MTEDVGKALQQSYKRRRLRADELIGRHPHAEHMLAFYINLMEVQEPIARQAANANWPTGEQQIQLDRLPLDDLLPLFRGLLREVAGFGTHTVRVVARAIEAAVPEFQLRLIQRFLARGTLDDLATALDCLPEQLGFFPRALLQPVTEALARNINCTAKPGRECPICRRSPQVTVTRDEAEVKGRRVLVCSLCASEWPYPRTTCPSCGESNPENLAYHVSDSLPHLRIEECTTCKRYLKAVDLRLDGKAIPLVDEVASVELDLWAQERGFEKIERNAVGM